MSDTRIAPDPAAPLSAGSSVQKRLHALESSGWGERLHLVQVRNACFWIFALGMLGGVIRMVKYVGPVGPYGTALTLGTVVFVIYAVPWWLYLTHLNRFGKVDDRATLTVFAWGFLGATFWIAIKANTALLTLYSKLFGQGFARDYGPALAAPFTEELAKACGVILLIGLAPRLVRTPFDGFILGAFAGLGFQISEDILYVFEGGTGSFGSDQIGSALPIILVRGLGGLVSHTLFSAIFCAGLIWLLNRDSSNHRVRGALLMLLAMFFHALWDSGGSYLYWAMDEPIAATLNFPIAIILPLIAIRRLLRVVRRQEHGWVRDILAPEVEAGIVTEAEVEALAGPKPRRQYLHRKPSGDERSGVKHVLVATEDLVEELATAGGEDTARVNHARSEVTRLRATPAT